MIRLTSRAWNNVLIIAMLALILLFNLTGGLFSGEKSEDEFIPALIPNDAVLTSIVTQAYTIERVGRGWRLVSTEDPVVANSESSYSLVRQNIDHQILFDTVSAWRQASLEPIGQATLANAIQVNVWLAGQSAPRHYLFFHVGTDTLVQYPAGGPQLYRVSDATWSQLFILEFFDA